MLLWGTGKRLSDLSFKLAAQGFNAPQCWVAVKRNINLQLKSNIVKRDWNSSLYLLLPDEFLKMRPILTGDFDNINSGIEILNGYNDVTIIKNQFIYNPS